MQKVSNSSHYYSSNVYGFNHRKTVNPELGFSLYYMEEKEKKRKREKSFLLSQLTACCFNTLPQAMQPQLHHLPWKDSREEEAAESATRQGSSTTMTVLCYEFTSNLTFSDPISCSQMPTFLNCYFWYVLLYSAVLITYFPVSTGFICLSSVQPSPWNHKGQHPG